MLRGARSRDRGVPRAATKAARITGAYIGLIGIALFVAPVTCFSIFFDPTEIRSIWIRVFGSLCALLGWYYVGASEDSVGFLEATVTGRLALAAALCLAVALDAKASEGRGFRRSGGSQYDELGVPPGATSEEIRLKYLEIAEEVEENLAFLLEQGEGGEYQEQVTARDDEDDDEFEWTRWEEEGEDAIALQPESSLAQASPSGEAEEEADILAEEFYRVSNLYQILSVPSLRKIYDEGGVEGLAMRVPALSKGLLEPERVLKMAQGIKTPTKVRESLLLRQEPRIKTFRRYQGKNSIRQVLRRITDCIRVWCFKSKESLKFRSNTIYEELPEIAVFGRVNAGKSAMLQHLFSATKPRKNGHFSVAQRPGKTKGIQVYCMNRRFTVADMPSYGKADDRNQEAADVHANWTQNWEGVVQEYLNTTHWLRAAIYVHEISKEVIPEDLKTIKMLRKQNIPILLVFTKDDKALWQNVLPQGLLAISAMDEPGIPAQAPPFLWFLIIAAAALWWLWPWLERWQESRRTSAAPFSPAADASPAVIQEPEPEEVEHEIIRPDVSFDSEEAFKAAYAEACRLVEELLQVPPMGHEFTAAAAGLHALANVVDRLFQEEDPRVAQLREDSESFGKSFASEGVRQLLCHAGFERRAMGRNGDGRAEWCFDHSDDSKLRALTVRLCIQRFTELQRLRGTHRWAQRDNSAVLPRASEASLE
ncbi:unnamed protein product, partial [Effrenium voratum]